jgi:hypothetical protein
VATLPPHSHKTKPQAFALRRSSIFVAEYAFRGSARSDLLRGESTKGTHDLGSLRDRRAQVGHNIVPYGFAIVMSIEGGG